MKEKIIEALREVYDPELPINIYDLGLIYKISYNKKKNFTFVLMTLTSPTCPVADYLKSNVKDAVEITTKGECEVEITFEPPWNSDMVLEEAREEMGLDLNYDEKEVSQNKSQNVFEENNKSLPLKKYICFNCLADDSKKIILKCKFKGDESFICFTCLKKL